jgi:hypothetical protein
LQNRIGACRIAFLRPRPAATTARASARRAVPEVDSLPLTLQFGGAKVRRLNIAVLRVR